jgi:preprotein translocase subunit SecY
MVQRAGGTSFIPLKLNSAGMIPLIFAFSILILPSTIASYFVNPMSTSFGARLAEGIFRAFDTSQATYWVILFILVVLFTFFYTLVTFTQMNLSDNLQKNGGFIPGIRPGKPTNDYLVKVMTRITWGGAIFLGFVAIMPFLAGQVTSFQALTLSSVGLLIIVGVALDTMRQLESQLLMRNYEGFIK